MSSPTIALARHLLRARSRTDTTATMLVGADIEGVLDIRIVDHHTRLLGWRAPPGWDAGLLLADAGVTRLSTTPPTGRHHESIAVVADRHRPPHVVSMDADFECQPCSLTDTLQRIISVPTAPPFLAAAALADAVWFHRLLEVAADHPTIETLPWHQVARRHPAACGVIELTPDALAARSRAYDQPGGWQRLAAVLVDPGLATPPDLVAWFDAGSYERWLLERLPDPLEAFTDLVGLVPADVASSIIRTIERSRDPAP